ncbi:MAG: hypothetical protein A2139_12615 [Desulfobacca sp. RBG_16_60_12]|nr:MAG: hypothetical protein A2139_12615 [Desulfobacca sp. RBG_16_60_12]
MFWGYSGTQFGATVRVSGFDTFIGTGSFSNDPLNGSGSSGYTLAPATLELFKVEVGWHGSGPIKFYAFDVAQGRWVLGHVVSGVVTSPRLLNPTLPLHFEVKNTGNTSNIILKTASAGIYRESVSPSDIPLDALIVSSGSSLSVGATELPVISIQVTGTINGQPNRARVQLQSISVADAGGAGTVMFVRGRLNPTTLTGPTFVPYNTGTSVCNFDTVASAVAGGTEVLGTVASGQSNTFQDLTALGIVLNPGDILSLTVQHVAGGASTNLLRCMLRELHTG